MRRTQILALVAGLGLAASAITPALADPVEVAEESSGYRDTTACASWSVDEPVEGGEEGETEHYNVYACGTLLDTDGDGTDDSASVYFARFGGPGTYLYKAAVPLDQVVIDVAGGTASITSDQIDGDEPGEPNCAPTTVTFVANGDAVETSESSGDIFPQLGEGTEVQLVTGREFSGTSRTADATGDVCGFPQSAGPSTEASLSESNTTTNYTSVSVNP